MGAEPPPTSILGAVGSVLDRLGGLDLLVNNGGGQFGAPAEEISSKGWHAVHRLNLDGNWDLTRRVAKQAMIPARSGLIVFLGFSPRHGIPNFAHASATRATLENLASGLSLIDGGGRCVGLAQPPPEPE